jgi:DNA polymerase-3 subunit chi
MTRIDFYILDGASTQDRFLLSCRIVEKAWKENHRVMIHAGSEQEAHHLDQLLWTFRDQSFVPHALLPIADTSTTPVIIGWNEDAGEESDILLNLSNEVPACFSRFERVIEPVDNDPERREACRQHYRYYRDRGYPLNDRKIQN